MKNFGEYSDLYSVIIGMVGSLLKSLKRKLTITSAFISVIAGAVLAYGTIGVIDQFFGSLNDKIIIVISFGVGWAANEITEHIDDYIVGLMDKYVKKADQNNSEPRE